jgi:hypothetical protein
LRRPTESKPTNIIAKRHGKYKKGNECVITFQTFLERPRVVFLILRIRMVDGGRECIKIILFVNLDIKLRTD